MTRTRWFAAAALLALAASAAQAHDSWFKPLPAEAGEARLALGTGNLYPLMDSGIDAQYLRRAACATPRGNEPLKPLGNTDTALVFAVPPAATSCWAQLQAFEIVLPADKIDLYLSEVHPTPAALARWRDAVTSPGAAITW